MTRPRNCIVADVIDARRIMRELRILSFLRKHAPATALADGFEGHENVSQRVVSHPVHCR